MVQISSYTANQLLLGSNLNYIPRALDLANATQKKSIFLFGPRQTGKSSLITNTFDLSPNTTFNLLDSALYLALSANPSLMRQRLAAADIRNGLVIIDEVQKLPVLLDEAHLLIEQYGLRFLMTGSNARKLRHGGVNLLGGRAREIYLHPLTYGELGEQHFSLIRALNRGLIPSVYFSDDPRADLRSYAGTYLDLEIASEAKIRNISAFSRFLQVAATSNGQIINQTTIASDAKVPRKTVNDYFEILVDTLVGSYLPAWTKSVKRKAFETAKFYFFDTGIARALREATPIKEKSPDFGEAFEQYIFHELKTYIDYRCPGTPLAYWRTTSGFEVDFILGDEVAIEVKAKQDVGGRDLKGLLALAAEQKLRRYLVVSLEDQARRVGEVEILPWRQFLGLLWDGALLSQQEAI